eukprot:CAMPEP_0178381014 /NCGR_PEP_ID=MMETSP0689_2-20121128/5763_1 /TAXON_ID=160604 /ORGANISM="Amphidinium massartii, Strain CS-259" /LENGTH=285 /DNA_ID=CAMNT_0020001181 /DNA_START=33 /DNA_END=887 /DNA_ORIENTATION=+
MQERLELMGPLLPLANFAQEYFQKLEYEASKQLQRLRSSGRLLDSFQSVAEGQSTDLEMARWLAVITDAMLALAMITGGASDPNKAGGQINTTASSPKSAKSWQSFGTGGSGAESQRVALARVQQDPFLPLPGEDDVQVFGVGGDDERRVRGIRGDSGGESKVLGAYHDYDPQRLAGRGAAQAASSSSSQPVGGFGQGASPDQSASLSGLRLGKGSWAVAYRQASGTRRDALRLLYRSGIVTQRELADDLTVISEEHIEECVYIATEMLKSRPLEAWAARSMDAR